MRQSSHDHTSKRRAEPVGGIHAVLDEAIRAAPMPKFLGPRRGIRLVNLDSDDQGDVVLLGLVEERRDRRTRSNGLDRKSINVGVIAAIIPEEEITEQVGLKDWQWIAGPQGSEQGNGREFAGYEFKGALIGYEL